VPLYLPSGNELLGVMKSEIENTKTFLDPSVQGGDTGLYFFTLQ